MTKAQAMRTDFDNQPVNREQLTAALARALRAVVGLAIVGAIYFTMIVLMVPELFDGSAVSAEANGQSGSSSAPASTELDEELKSSNAVTQHG